MSWEKSSYTKAGAALLSESLSGGALTITRAVSGTGSVDTDLSAETAVSGDTHELSLMGIETVTDDGKTARKVSIHVTGAADTYVMHQIGVFGVLNNGTETLLFLMQDEHGIEVPAASTNSEFSFEIAVLLAISAEANLSITVDPQVEAIMLMVREMVLDEISQHNDDPDAHAKIITEATSKALKKLEASGEIMTETQVKKLIQQHSGSGYTAHYTLTLLAGGWKSAPEANTEYSYIYDAELSDSTSEIIPLGTVRPDSFSTTSKAGVLNGCETNDGFVRFFSKRIPENDIQVELTLLGKGGGSSEQVIATRDRLGCVKIGDGIEITGDGTISAHAKVSEDQMATTDDVSEMLKEIYDE